MPEVYFYLVYFIILFIFFTIVRDRKLFPKNSSIMLLILSSLLVFFGSYLFIRSFGSGYRYGSGTCGPDGCFFSQSLVFAIDEILFNLLFPVTLFTALAALYLLISRDHPTFDAAGIVFAGSFMDIYFMLGGMKLAGIAGIAATIFLIIKSRKYRNIYHAITAMFLFPLFFW